MFLGPAAIVILRPYGLSSLLVLLFVTDSLVSSPLPLLCSGFCPPLL